MPNNLLRTMMLAGSMLVSSAKSDAADSDSPALPAAITTRQVKGIVKSVDVEGLKVVVAHEAIRGYMDAMTMEFRVRQASDLSGIKAGDRIRFRLSTTEKSGWIDAVQKLGEQIVATPTESVPFSPTPASSPQLGPGDPVPECTLRDEQGQSFSLRSLRGQTLALSFIFTRCPFPEFCPRMNNNLSEAQRELLGTHPNGRWKLISVSIDPEYDTPDRLREYATRYGPDRSRWVFATGEPSRIQRLASSFGLAVHGQGAAIQHNLRTVVVDPRGRVQRIFIGNEWRPRELVAEVNAAMLEEQSKHQDGERTH